MDALSTSALVVNECMIWLTLKLGCFQRHPFIVSNDIGVGGSSYIGAVSGWSNYQRGGIANYGGASVIVSAGYATGVVSPNLLTGDQFPGIAGGTATGFISLGSVANGGFGNLTGFTIGANANLSFGKMPYSVGIALGGAKLQTYKKFHPAGNKPTPQSVEDFRGY